MTTAVHIRRFQRALTPLPCGCRKLCRGRQPAAMGADAESTCTESRTDSWSPDGARNPWSAPTTELWAPTPAGVSATGETAYVGQRPPRARRQAWLMRRAQGEGRRILILTHGQLRQCLSGRPVDRPRWHNRICGHQPKILSSTLQTLMDWLVRPAAPSDHGPGPPALTARTCTS